MLSKRILVKKSQKWPFCGIVSTLMAVCLLGLSGQVKADSNITALPKNQNESQNALTESKYEDPQPQPAGHEVIIPTNTNLAHDTSYAKQCVFNSQNYPDTAKFYWIVKPQTLINGQAKGIVGIWISNENILRLNVVVKIAGQKQAKLMHNAYLYDHNGKRKNDLILRAGSILNLMGSKKIKQRKFCLLDDDNYVAQNNVFGVNRKLRHNARTYNQLGELINKKSIKKGTVVKTYGNPVKIRGLKLYPIATDRYLLAANFKANNAKHVASQKQVSNKQEKRLMHSSYLYNEHGRRVNGLILATGSRVKISKYHHLAAGRFFYAIGNGYYVPVRNVTGLKMERVKVDHPVTVYNRYGRKIGTIPVNKKIQTYGDPFKLKGQHYYIVGKGKLIRSREITGFD